MRGEDDHRHARLMLLDLGEQRHAVHLVHTQIADHQIDLFARQQAQRFLAAFGGGDVKTFAGQTHAQQLQQAGIVVNQEQIGRFACGHCAWDSLLAGCGV